MKCTLRVHKKNITNRTQDYMTKMSDTKKGKKTTGAVMVVGGGIGGVQSALDLAESGYKVYLVEKSSSIGGVMAQLDKTFPTNDCSMCILSPKLVDCARHLNIELLTMTDLEGVAGEAGNFKVKVRRRARYVDMDKCTGCGDCEIACPVRNIPDTFNMPGVGHIAEINVGKIVHVVQYQVVGHALIQGCRIMVRQVQVIAGHTYGLPPQCGNPGRMGQVQKSISGFPFQLPV